ASGSVFPLGTTGVTCTAMDASGNQSQSSFNVIVRDTTPPNLTTMSDITVEQSSPSGTAVTFANPTATDICDPNPTVTCSPASGTAFALGVTKVTCTATDASGNQGQTSFNVIVRDTTPPTIVQRSDIVVEQATRQGTVVTF